MDRQASGGGGQVGLWQLQELVVLLRCRSLQVR